LAKNADLEMSLHQEIILAYLLDLWVGDPKNFPHPVRWIGQAAGWLERVARRYVTNLFVAGCVTTVLMLFMTVVGAWILLWVLGRVHPYLEVCGSVYLFYACLSVRSLYDESKPVADHLHEGQIDEARISLSHIVGRDTKTLDAHGITRATVETVAENTVDGIVAPLFYACLGGAPLALGYKCINTLDSLFGYRNKFYEKFGKFPARLDDVANWIPARIGGALMVLASWFCGYRGLSAWRIMLRDGGKHLSPNAGIPEAAMAGALGLQLGGPSDYNGILVNKLFIGDSLKEIEIDDISRSHRVMFATSLLSLLFFVWIFLELGIR
jgi:adenosylcobinamide-phosphate synthase